jgi:ABC-type Zn uptake system ZnuABC Zn-binding protein ZnuA
MMPRLGKILLWVAMLLLPAVAAIAEHSHHSPLIERVAAAAGVPLAPPLYTDALGQPGSPGDTYSKMMRYNVTTIVEALSR